MGRRSASIALVAALSGCDPVYSIRGTVLSVPKGAPNRAEPLPDAEVFETCSGHEQQLAVTNADGYFDYGNVGGWNEDCELSVSVPDKRHEVVRTSVGELCRQANEPSCGNVQLTWNVSVPRNDAEPLRRTVVLSLASRTPGSRFYIARGKSMEALCLPPCTTTITAGKHVFAFGPTTEGARVVPVGALRQDTRIVAEFHQDQTLRVSGGVLVLLGGLGWITTTIAGLATKDNALILWGGVASLPVFGAGVLMVEQGRPHVTADVTPAPR